MRGGPPRKTCWEDPRFAPKSKRPRPIQPGQEEDFFAQRRQQLASSGASGGSGTCPRPGPSGGATTPRPQPSSCPRPTSGPAYPRPQPPDSCPPRRADPCTPQRAGPPRRMNPCPQSEPPRPRAQPCPSPTPPPTNPCPTSSPPCPKSSRSRGQGSAGSQRRSRSRGSCAEEPADVCPQSPPPFRRPTREPFKAKPYRPPPPTGRDLTSRKPTGASNRQILRRRESEPSAASGSAAAAAAAAAAGAGAAAAAAAAMAAEAAVNSMNEREQNRRQECPRILLKPGQVNPLETTVITVEQTVTPPPSPMAMCPGGSPHTPPYAPPPPLVPVNFQVSPKRDRPPRPDFSRAPASRCQHPLKKPSPVKLPSSTPTSCSQQPQVRNLKAWVCPEHPNFAMVSDDFESSPSSSLSDIDAPCDDEFFEEEFHMPMAPRAPPAPPRQTYEEVMERLEQCKKEAQMRECQRMREMKERRASCPPAPSSQNLRFTREMFTTPFPPELYAQSSDTDICGEEPPEDDLEERMMRDVPILDRSQPGEREHLDIFSEIHPCPANKEEEAGPYAQELYDLVQL